MNYKVTVDGKEIEYGALVEKSRFSDKEWSAIYAEIVKQNWPEVFETRKSDTAFIDTLGALVSLEERYEALLELLPQNQFSYAGTHPKWVADAVGENTLNKEDTMLDVSDLIGRCSTIEELKNELTKYFKLEELEVLL
ncbi:MULTISPECIES: hypothetical protein [unclassified Streptococcus]|uniref:hypothetical protein n=1 Tax=unclassified Streptococcus TaxID=2608887 RepID=UPI0020C840A3|nr:MULTISPECIES: hypothetical protein [unclassified Streptococcus]MCP9060405.1 hypothetical protein [Streptococcus sp. CF7_Ac1-12]MCP9084986.1 hypothetical protein [Streptococcus sp. CF7_Ac1-8]